MYLNHFEKIVRYEMLENTISTIGISNSMKIIRLLPSKHLAAEDLQSLLHKSLSAPQPHFPGALPINGKI